jgi:hypothetical protein
MLPVTSMKKEEQVAAATAPSIVEQVAFFFTNSVNTLTGMLT